jgi:hypothetical protein
MTNEYQKLEVKGPLTTWDKEAKGTIEAINLTLY